MIYSTNEYCKAKTLAALTSFRMRVISLKKSTAYKKIFVQHCSLKIDNLLFFSDSLTL